MRRQKRIILILIILLFTSFAAWSDSSEWADGYDNGKYAPEEYEHRRDFIAFTVSFDSIDDDDGDGVGEAWGIPAWVAYEAMSYDGEPEDYARSSWTNDNELVAAGIAPKDYSYHYRGATSKLRNQYEHAFYERGHLMPHELSERLGKEAADQTNTMLNVVPQASDFNGGVWKSLEALVDKWADEYGSVWVITGPIFANRRPTVWLGEPQLVKKLVAVPHELFKIVVRETAGNLSAMAFIFPNHSFVESDVLAYISSVVLFCL